MRMLDAIPPENEFGHVLSHSEHAAGREGPVQPRPVAWGTCLDGTLCAERRKEEGLLEEPPGSRPNHADEAIATTRYRRLRPSSPAVNRNGKMSTLMFLSFLLQPALAVLLSKFENCLPSATKDSDPPQLQWIPLYVGATFDNKGPSHNLRVTVWGNVTGAYNPTTVALPAWGSDEWNNPNFTDGKIVDDPFPTSANLLTTLHSKIDVLTYEPYAADFDFCNGSLTNASCPLGPVFNITDMCVSAFLSVSAWVVGCWREWSPLVLSLSDSKIVSGLWAFPAEKCKCLIVKLSLWTLTD